MPASLVHNAPEMKLPSATSAITIELTAVLVALTADEPQVLTLEDGALLPSGPFESDHPTLQTGLRAWVEQQTGLRVGYVEQLYTSPELAVKGWREKIPLDKLIYQEHWPEASHVLSFYREIECRKK